MLTEKKSYLLVFTESPDYLYANLSAETLDEEIIREFLREIREKSDQSGLDRILVYRNIPLVWIKKSLIDSVNEWIETFKGKKVALVNPYSELDAEMGYAMTVAQNAGGNHDLFSDIKSAQEWLLQ